MTEVKASCPECGDITLTAEEVRLVVSSIADRSYYAFSCHRCMERVQKHANEDIIKLLTLGGIEPERIDVPAEALEEHGDLPLTTDDLLDFINNLADL